MISSKNKYTMKRKASTSFGIFKKENAFIQLSSEMIVAIMLLLLPTSVLAFTIGNEPVRTRSVGTKSTYSDPHTSSRSTATLLSASRNRNLDHSLLGSPTSSPASSKDEQAVDEYLEFLDRRYRYVKCVARNVLARLYMCIPWHNSHGT